MTFFSKTQTAHEPTQRLWQCQAGMLGRHGAVHQQCRLEAGSINSANRFFSCAHQKGLSKPVASLAPTESATTAKRAKEASSRNRKPAESSPLIGSTHQCAV